jgi:hypothetical protein
MASEGVSVLLVKEQRDPGGSPIVALATVSGVRPLPSVDGSEDIAEPPPGSSQPVQGAWCLVAVQLGLEGHLRWSPFAHAKSLPPIDEGLARSRVSHG